MRDQRQKISVVNLQGKLARKFIPHYLTRDRQQKSYVANLRGK